MGELRYSIKNIENGYIVSLGSYNERYFEKLQEAVEEDCQAEFK